MFYRRKETKDGLRKDCKECTKTRVNRYRQENETKIKEKVRIRYYKNPEKYREKTRQYKIKNREKVAEYTREKQHNFCINNTKIENYEKACADNFVNWERHHRLETHTSEGDKRLVQITPEELKALDVYYNRPPEELIYLTVQEHRKLHKE
jgi:hypothetical protein